MQILHARNETQRVQWSGGIHSQRVDVGETYFTIGEFKLFNQKLNICIVDFDLSIRTMNNQLQPSTPVCAGGMLCLSGAAKMASLSLVS